MFQLYVDPIGDSTHVDADKILGFPLIDEPLLSHVFVDNKFVVLTEFGGKFNLPAPETLISMKLKSVATRTKDDKRLKDISDIYALLWYSEIDFAQLKQRVQNMLGSKIDDVVSEFIKDEYVTVSNALGIESEEIIRVITELTK